MRTGNPLHFAWQLPLYAMVIYAWFDAAAAAVRAVVAGW